MKKLMAIFFAFILIFGNISSVQAASDINSIGISLDNIRDIMIENSLDMQTYSNNLEKTIEEYDDLKDEIDDKDDDISKINEDIKNLDTTDPDYTDSKEVLNTQLKTLNSELSTLKNKRDSMKYTVKSARIQYDQNVENAIYSAQQQYLAYLTAKSNRELSESKVTSKEKELNTYKIKYNSGFISKNEYDSYVRDNTDFTNELDSLKNTENIALINLKNTLGIDSSINIVVKDNIITYLDKVSKIDVEEDLNEMLDNSLDIKLKDINIDSLEDSDSSDYDLDNAEISLDQVKAKAKINFNQQYNTLIASYNSIKSSYDKLQSTEKNTNFMETKYSKGFVSMKEVNDAKITLNEERSKFQKDQDQFYLDYLHYIQMKEGY